MMKHTLMTVAVMLLFATGLRAQGCSPVYAPWWADFSTDSSFMLTAFGDATWTRNASGSSYRIRVQINGNATGNSGWILSQPIILPADITGLKLFWSENRGNNTFAADSLNMKLRVFSTSAFDTLYFGSAYQATASLT